MLHHKVAVPKGQCIFIWSSCDNLCAGEEIHLYVSGS